MTMKPSLTINVNLQTSKALYTPTAINASKYHLSITEPTMVGVFGLFQIAEEGDTDAYFVVKLPNGQCCYAGVDQIKFIEDREDEMD